MLARPSLRLTRVNLLLTMKIYSEQYVGRHSQTEADTSPSLRLRAAKARFFSLSYRDRSTAGRNRERRGLGTKCAGAGIRSARRRAAFRGPAIQPSGAA